MHNFTVHGLVRDSLASVFVSTLALFSVYKAQIGDCFNGALFHEHEASAFIFVLVKHLRCEISLLQLTVFHCLGLRLAETDRLSVG
jgi:hypothetical protein